MTDLTKALLIAVKAHDGQVDKQGAPYILHVFRVMLRMKSVEDMVVAALHDVVEDTSASIEGFSDEIVVCVDALTRRAEESYEEYIERVKLNKQATRVKLADLADNTDASRGPNSPERLAKYTNATASLSAQ